MSRIFLKSSIFLSLIILFAGCARQFSNAEKGALAGVNIIVKGRVIGTITDINGAFNLKVNDEPPMTLTFSFVGYRTQEISITNANTANIEIKMEEQTIRVGIRAIFVPVAQPIERLLSERDIDQEGLEFREQRPLRINSQRAMRTRGTLPKCVIGGRYFSTWPACR